eukprot:5553760-Prymnesium_polylepis.1
MAYDAPGRPGEEEEEEEEEEARSWPVRAYRILLLLLPGGGVGRYARPAVPLARGTCASACRVRPRPVGPFCGRPFFFHRRLVPPHSAGVCVRGSHGGCVLMYQHSILSNEY